MYTPGIVRNIDCLGRVVIPKEIRETFGIEVKDSIEIFVDGEAIILKAYAPGCIFCGSCKEIVDFDGKKICGDCRESIGKLV